MREPVFGGIHATGQPGRDVNVAVDKARHHCLAGEIDDFGAGGFDKAGFNRGDAIVLDEDGNLAARGIGHTVEQGAGVNDHIAGRGGCGKQRNNQGDARGEFHQDKWVSESRPFEANMARLIASHLVNSVLFMGGA